MDTDFLPKAANGNKEEAGTEGTAGELHGLQSYIVTKLNGLHVWEMIK